MSKLKRFNKFNKKNIMPLVALCLVVAVVSVAISYAVYQKTDEVLFINARVGEFETSSSDIELAMTLDGEDVDVPPSKGYYNVTVECDHADGSWDKDRWGANIDNITSNRVKCNVNFESYKLSIKDVKIGDYIKMTPTATSYTISTSLTGYSSNQTINPSELNLWRVIRKNEDGTVDVVSEFVSSKGVSFYGKTGFMNLVGGLNTIAAQYTDENHVQSARHIGYSNQTQIITNTSKLNQTTAPWKKSTSVYNQWTGCNSSSYLCGADESLGAGDIGYESDYSLVNRVYGTMKSKAPNGYVSAYWLATRRYIYDEDVRYYFSGRWVQDSGNLDHINMYYRQQNSFHSEDPRFAIRPIVTLKSTTEILNGGGTSTSPYNLN